MDMQIKIEKEHCITINGMAMPVTLIEITNKMVYIKYDINLIGCIAISKIKTIKCTDSNAQKIINQFI